MRPYVAPEVISANIESVEKYGSAVTYTPCFETIVLSRDGAAIDAIPTRRESYTAQAPQSFRLGDILAAHERIRARPDGYTDIVDQAIAHKCQMVQLFKPYFDQALIDRARAAGLRVNVFWSDDPAEAKRFLDMGVDTILTNDYQPIAAATGLK